MPVFSPNLVHLYENSICPYYQSGEWEISVYEGRCDIAFVGESVLILLIKVRKIITVSVFPYPTFVFRKMRREKFVSSMSPLDLSTLYRIVSGRKTAYLIECLGYYSNVFNLFSGRLHKKNACFLCNSSGFNIQ